jgi:DNA-binding CsgD family transcriptional regulator
MGSGILSIHDPGVSELLCDHTALAVWEQLRVARRAMDLRAVAAKCGLEHVDALRALDRWTAAGMAERVTSARRSSIRWRATADRIVVAFDPEDHAHAAALRDRVDGAHADHVDGTIARFGTRGPAAGSTCRHRGSCTVRLAPQDFPELQRRIQALHDFLDVISKRGSHGTTSQAVHSNHAVRVTVEPIEGPILPLPRIEVLPRTEAERRLRPLAGRARGAALSERERDVADAMARGLTRPAIAGMLGISPNTVGTLSLRIYRKLGVRTRLELASAMQAMGAITSAQ